MPVVARVDALSGTFLDAIAVKPEGNIALPDLGDVRDQLVQGDRNIRLDEQVVELKKADYTGLWWQPCLESYSPFYPFFGFNINGEDVYLAFDVLLTRPDPGAHGLLPFYRKFSGLPLGGRLPDSIRQERLKRRGVGEKLKGDEADGLKGKIENED